MYILICCFKNELNIVADGEVTLDTFCEFQQTVNPAGDDNPMHFDYAILITGYVTRLTYSIQTRYLCLCVYVCTYTIKSSQCIATNNFFCT